MSQFLRPAALIVGSIGLGAALTAMATTQASAQTTLRVAATPVIFQTMFEEMVAAFEASHPEIDIDLEVPPGEQDFMIQDILRRSLIDDVPDVTFQGYNHLSTLVDRGLPVPLEPFIAADPEWTAEQYSASVANSGTVGDTVYGLGVGISFPVFYYNTELVAEALGPDAAFPQTWDGIIDLSERLQALRPDMIGGYHRSHPWMFQTHLESRGSRLASADETEILFDGEEGQEAFRVLQAFGQAGQARAEMTREQARQAFVAGTLGLFTDSSSLLSRHEEQIGGRFEIDVARFPMPSDDGHVPAAGIASVMMTTDPDQQQAAWTFMRFVSGPEGQLIVAQNTAYVPANAAAFENSPELTAFFAERPKMAAALETVPYASAWYAFPGPNASRIDETIRDAMADVLALRSEPDEALTELRAEVQRLLP